MPSRAYRQWNRMRAAELDEVEAAHALVGGTSRGRRYATQQINRAYAVLLASQFQGFCRDLHTQAVDHLLATLRLAAPIHAVVKHEFDTRRQLARGNAQSGSIGADFGRLGIM